MLLLLNGCRTLYKPELAQIKEEKIIKEESTKTNLDLQANIGDDLYYYNKYELFLSFYYVNDQSIKYPKPSHNLWSGIGFDESQIITVEKNCLPVNQKMFSCLDKPNEVWLINDSLRYLTMSGDYVTSPSYYVIENNCINRLLVTAVNDYVMKQYTFEMPIPVHKVLNQVKGDNIFSFELIYMGIQNNSIVVNYREFSKDMIRGAFNQTIYYNLNDIKDNIIQYKNIKIKVLEYNNQNIKYKVIS